MREGELGRGFSLFNFSSDINYKKGEKYMTIWAIIYLVWIVLGLGIHLAKDGEPRDGNYSFWTALISTGLQCFLLYKAGFFG